MNFTVQIMNNPAYQDTDIVKKCRKYPQFYQELVTNQENYIHDLNIALYTNLQSLEKLGVFYLRVEKEHLYVSFFAYLMPEREDLQSKFYLLWIRMLDEHLRNYLGKKYSIIYYHSLCESSLPYNFLVLMFKKLPIYYYAMLDKMYTIEATFFLRKSAGIFDFGRLFKLFERKQQNIEKLKEFAMLPEVMKYNLMIDMPERLMEVWIEKVKKKMLKWGDGMAAHQSLPVYPTTAPKKDFLMVGLRQHVSKNIVQRLTSQDIPVPLSILLSTLKKNHKFLQLQGIFRKSGSIEEEEQIIDELMLMSQGDQFKNLAEYTGYSIAGVVKKFFTKLLHPIVPYDIYDRIMNIVSTTAISPEQEVNFVLDFLKQLPDLNCKVLFHFLSFLKYEVVSLQEKNKMSNYNMAVCIFPCIFKSKQITQKDLINSGKFVGILKIIFTRFEEIISQIKHTSVQKNKQMGGMKSLRISLA